MAYSGLVWWCGGWESTCQCKGCRFDPWSGKVPHDAEKLKPVCHNYRACMLEPESHNYRACMLEPESHNRRACMLEPESHNCRACMLEPESHNCRACMLEPESHNCWACMLEPESHNCWARVLQLREPGACALHKRSHCNEKPVPATKSSPCSVQLEESLSPVTKTQCNQK